MSDPADCAESHSRKCMLRAGQPHPGSLLQHFGPHLPSGAPMLLWAADAKLAPAHANIVLWQGAARKPGVRSITQYIEIHAKRFGGVISLGHTNLGETPVLGRRLRERFKLADGTSFWWLSAFVEQSSWKQSSLETMLKLFAFGCLIEAGGSQRSSNSWARTATSTSSCRPCVGVGVFGTAGRGCLDNGSSLCGTWCAACRDSCMD